MRYPRGIRYGSRGPRRSVIGRSLAVHSTCLVLFLTACATKPTPLPPPIPAVQVVTVDRVITQPCISQLPDLPMYSDTDEALQSIGDDFAAAWTGIALLKGGRLQRDLYIDQLRAILQNCTSVNH